MVLYRNDFEKLVVSDMDKESLYSFKYNIEILKNFNCLDIICYVCQEVGHIAKFCPKVHYMIPLNKRIKISI